MPDYQRYESALRSRRIPVSKIRTYFNNVCILCGMAVVVAITVKVVMSLFS